MDDVLVTARVRDGAELEKRVLRNERISEGARPSVSLVTVGWRGKIEGGK